MNHITPKDIEALRKRSKRSLPFFLFGMACFYLIVGLWNLRLCARAAQLDGMDLSAVFDGWIEGADALASYSGLYLMALERLTIGILQLGLVVPFVIGGIGLAQSSRRNRRLIAYIEAKENEARQSHAAAMPVEEL